MSPLKESEKLLVIHSILENTNIYSWRNNVVGFIVVKFLRYKYEQPSERKLCYICPCRLELEAW